MSDKSTISALITANLASGTDIAAVEHREVENALNTSAVNIDEATLQTMTGEIAGPTITTINNTLALKADLVGGLVPVAQLPSSVQGGITVIGSWNASTNTPDLSIATPDQGEAYIVSVAGSTSLNGETNWKAKDLVVWDDTLAGNWFKLDNTDDVISVSGKTGVVTLVKADVGLGNVDNTSDVDKPVSTAQSTALDDKISKTDTVAQSVVSDLTLGADKKFALSASAIGNTNLFTLTNPNGTHTIRLGTDALQWILANTSASFEIVNSALTQINFAVEDNGDASIAGDLAMVAGKTVDGRDISADGLVLDDALSTTEAGSQSLTGALVTQNLTVSADKVFALSASSAVAREVASHTANSVLIARTYLIDKKVQHRIIDTGGAWSVSNNANVDQFKVDHVGDVDIAGNIAQGTDKEINLTATAGTHTLMDIDNPSGKILEIESADTNVFIRNNVGSVLFESTGAAKIAMYGVNQHASYTGALINGDVTRAANSAYNLLQLRSGAGADTEFLLTGDGNGKCDGSWTGGGADYAEYFEWEDGNPDNEDRVGHSVTLVLDDDGMGDKIAIAKDGDVLHGVISGNPSVVGDGDMGWKKKYLTDDYGRKEREDHQVIEWVEVTQKKIEAVEEELDEDGEVIIEAVKGQEEKTKNHSYEADKIPEGITAPKDAVITEMVGKDGRPILNPDYDPDFEYIHRADRKEWDTVGLLGKLRVRNDQVVDPSWKKMRKISDAVTEYFVK